MGFSGLFEGVKGESRESGGQEEPHALIVNTNGSWSDSNAWMAKQPASVRVESTTLSENPTPSPAEVQTGRKRERTSSTS